MTSVALMLASALAGLHSPGLSPSNSPVAAPLEPTAVRAAPATRSDSIRWDARAAEHLLNRAGFGGTTEEVARFVEMGMARAIASLFPDPKSVPEPRILAQRSLHGGLESPSVRHEGLTERREGYSRLQPDLISPLNKYGDWWIERMVESDDRLRDQMTIFWHGHWVSSVKEVGSSADMIRQLQFLRDNALGRFEVLARGMGRDPAMLRYLNNDTNVKDHPNENWARELMELFSLGDGNYTETDIKEAARAFTGWSRDDGEYSFKRVDHDFGQKSVLGTSGNLDGDHVVDVILEQPACARFLARKLIAYFEGVAPDEARVEEYAQALRTTDYDIGMMLQKLFADPRFYRDEVVGTRVAGPVQYLIGSARRLQFAPPGQMVLNAGDVLGQRLFWPPSVKGWEEGMAWITTASLMARSNMIAVMLGLIDVQTLMHDAEFASGMEMDGEEKQSRTNGFNQLRYIQRTGWEPELSLVERARAAGRTSDAQLVAWLVDELYAIPTTVDMHAKPLEFLRAERERLVIEEGSVLEAGKDGELLLRELAHFLLSMPEAQML